MKPTDRPFIVGRRTRKATTVVLLRPHHMAPPETRPAEKPLHPIPGPWTLRAMVTATPAP